MHITLLTGEYPPQPGGVGAYTQCLANALVARGQRITVLTIQAGSLLGLELGSNEPRLCLKLGQQLTWSHRCWPAIISALDQLQPTWLHIQYQTGAYAMAPGINLLPWRLRSLAGRPQLAVTFHDLLVPYLWPKAGPLRTWVNQRLAHDVDALVVTNAGDAAQVQQWVPRPPPAHYVIPIGSNIAVAPPPGYERDAWRAALGIAPEACLVAYFGLLSPSKGAEQLLAALAQLAQPWHLLLIGGAATAPQDVAYANELRRQISALGLTARVHITGHVDDSYVSAHLLAADAVALPFRDGASFRRGSLLAALAHGCPVVTTYPQHPADHRLLTDAALLCPIDDPVALRNALQRLAADPALRRSLTAKGRNLAARFSWAQIAAEHERIYTITTQAPDRVASSHDGGRPN
ncbi:glycosyltransferase family 4 protein [Candidatus Viridilinea mediisalina]|uniref:Glycosyltransferase subfamily 4-like N-terminal domain-containing protein n=1 Tax=Candidatus Viridilinea mediisalina TaxID=2024553 RepID=A0A2A6RI91_9CHLR|nr:glycosyltransferase family 4 protein [Candidatus Viridilinea mediisalina]PDW02560.1 hypothetical protein CJ255_13210 [Candidatus Viridilinea mediisalina]